MSLIFHLVWAQLVANVHPGPGWGLPWVRATISSSWSPSSDFFSCICFALNIMKSKTLQRFSPKILVADLKVCKILLCVSSLPWCYFFFFIILKLAPGEDIPHSCCNRKCFVCSLDLFQNTLRLYMDLENCKEFFGKTKNLK